MLKKIFLTMVLLGCTMKSALAEQITFPAENLNFQIAGVVLERADIPCGQERDYQPITLRLPRYSAAIGKGDVRTWWVKEPLWILAKNDVISMSPRLDEMLEDGHLDIRTCIHYSHRHLSCPKNTATALKMLARCPTLLCFLHCIRAFMS